MTEQIRKSVKRQLFEIEKTQGWLADEVQVTQSHLSNVLSGVSDGSVATWLAIFKCLDLTITVAPKPPKYDAESKGF